MFVTHLAHESSDIHSLQKKPVVKIFNMALSTVEEQRNEMIIIQTDAPKKEMTLAASFVLGGMASITAECCTYPLDVITISSLSLSHSHCLNIAQLGSQNTSASHVAFIAI